VAAARDDEVAAALGVLMAAADGAPGTVQGLRRLSGGASQQTWAFDWLPAAGVPQALILRRAPPVAEAIPPDTPAPPLTSPLAAGLRTEAALIPLAGRHGVPVPAVRAVAAPGHALGEAYVMQRLAGETLGRRIVSDPALQAARGRLAGQCGQALARLHAVPLAEAPPLRQAGPAAELQHYRRWLARHEAAGSLRPVFTLALQWLAAHQPAEPAGLRIVHGDFRNGNLMVNAEGLHGVLDWELAHAGDPMEDLGWLCVASWRFGGDADVGGFGTRDALFESYASAGGRVDAARVHWWQVMGSLKWGLICLDMLAAWTSGREPVVEKAAIGRRASEAEIDLLALLLPREAPLPHAA